MTHFRGTEYKSHTVRRTSEEHVPASTVNKVVSYLWPNGWQIRNDSSKCYAFHRSYANPVPIN